VTPTWLATLYERREALSAPAPHSPLASTAPEETVVAVCHVTNSVRPAADVCGAGTGVISARRGRGEELAVGDPQAGVVRPEGIERVVSLVLGMAAAAALA
jgi:hypothetical protein